MSQRNRAIWKMIRDAAATANLQIEKECEAAAVPADWSETCLLLRSDNLAALQGLIESGIEVDFCYIDPPYNTGSDFIYNDNRRSKSDGIWGSHGPWMSFMLPRLIYAREILRAHGVMAVSIDDYAYPQLKVLMDLVFGEGMSLGTLVVVRSKNGLGANRNVADMHEYVALYARSETARLKGLQETDERTYNKKDEHGAYSMDGLFRKKGDASRREDRPSMFYPLYVAPDGQVFTERTAPDQMEVFPRDSQGVDRRWLWGKEKATKESWKLYGSARGVVYVKNYSAEGKRVRLRSVLDRPEYLTDVATREVKAIFKEKAFDTPKPLRLMTDLIDCCCEADGLVLDFFAGSGTSGEAVAMLNAEREISRRVILVEHDAPIPAKHVAQSLGLKTTAEITKARLEHASEKYSGFSFRVA